MQLQLEACESNCSRLEHYARDKEMEATKLHNQVQELTSSMAAIQAQEENTGAIIAELEEKHHGLRDQSGQLLAERDRFMAMGQEAANQMARAREENQRILADNDRLQRELHQALNNETVNKSLDR